LTLISSRSALAATLLTLGTLLAQHHLFSHVIARAFAGGQYVKQPMDRQVGIAADGGSEMAVVRLVERINAVPVRGRYTAFCMLRRTA